MSASRRPLTGVYFHSIPVLSKVYSLFFSPVQIFFTCTIVVVVCCLCNPRGTGRSGGRWLRCRERKNQPGRGPWRGRLLPQLGSPTGHEQ